MVKHNNAVPGEHFHKDWQRFVKTWFDQPAKKKARRAARAAKAAAIAPRPLTKLRPIVRGQTQKYNKKVRAGRGFTFDELKAAGINRHEALKIGVTVDHRRKNRSEEAFQLNVDRLKQYKSKLVLFPLKPTSKRAKQSGATAAARSAKTTMDLDAVFPAALPEQPLEIRKIETSERDFEAFSTLRKARTDALLWGARMKRQENKANEKTGKSKAKADHGDDE